MASLLPIPCTYLPWIFLPRTTSQLPPIRSTREPLKEDTPTAPRISCGKRDLLAGLCAMNALSLSLTVGEARAEAQRPQFYELEGSDGVKALDIREGSGKTPHPGDKVAIHYYARLAAKQGWRFDSTYDHKDSTGAPQPFVFVVGSGTVKFESPVVFSCGSACVCLTPAGDDLARNSTVKQKDCLGAANLGVRKLILNSVQNCW